jgi:phage terminase Nu1 subunit (DNA packaging protein)
LQTQFRFRFDVAIMGLPQKVSTSGLAAVLGITERAVTKLVDRKILHREARGCFDLADSVQAYIAHREAVVAAQHGMGAYGKARAELTLERARLMRLNREELEGRLVPVTEVITAGTAVATTIKTRVLGVAAKIAPQLINLRTPAQAQAIVYEANWEALDELSKIETIGKRH